jgi:N-acetylmuramoyl-L-alanine amidase
VTPAFHAHRTRVRRGLLACLLASLALPGAAGADPAGPSADAAGRSPTAPKAARRLDAAQARPTAAPDRPAADERVTLRGDRDLVLEVTVRAGDTYVAIGQRYLIDLRELEAVRGRNGDRPPSDGGVVAIPYSSLNDRYKIKVIRDLFPEDGPREGNWIHRTGSGRLQASQETLWNVALWLTGRGENFGALADRNALPGLVPAKDQEIVVPGELLLPPFAALAGLRTASTGTPGPAASPADAESDDFTEVPGEPEPGPGTEPSKPPGPGTDATGQLRYGSDERGAFARYSLKRGEALYSVVMRFTGRVDSQEVNELAFAIAGRSGIQNVKDIPAGYGVKIPLDDLLPEYLPATDARRLSWESSRAKVARYTNPSPSRNLAGVTVILDAGHGGRDRGAAHNGVAEHEYVYDILCRIKAVLERDTSAGVLTTIKDRREGYRIRDSTLLSRNQAEVLLTDPPFPLTEPYVGVNLRWYLTNSYYRRLVAEGSDPLKVVFTSLHADARHPGLGGAMVYVPGEEYRRSRYGYSGPVYARTREVREKPYVSFTRAERERSEGLSRQFAGTLMRSFRAHDVAVHPFDPVRERIVRKRRSWVPAVLRCSEVPVEVLIEVSNLNNPTDSRLLSDPAYRQRVAEAYVDALARYYGGAAPRPAPFRAAASGGH